MRKLWIATSVALLCAGPAFAGPKDQTKDTLVGPQGIAGNATVNNATTAFSFQSKGCKVQIKAKGLVGTTDGDVIVCVAGADVIANPVPAPPGAGNGVVLLGEVKKGGLGLKADLTEIGCGAADNVQFNGELRCYLDDPAYYVSAAMPPYPVGGWQADCTAIAGDFVAVENPKCATNECDLTKGAGLPVIVGLCQGFTTLGGRLTGPSSALIATRGGRGFLIP